MNKNKRVTELYSLTCLTNNRFKKTLKRDLKLIQKKLFSDNKKPRLEHLFALLFLNSNMRTIGTVEQLIEKVQFDEALALERVILERAALVFKSLNDSLSLEEIEKLKSYNCITSLKRHFDIGRMYGVLSEVTHSKPHPYIFFSIVKSYMDQKYLKENKAKIDDIKLMILIQFCFIVEITLAVTKFLVKEFMPKQQSAWVLDRNKSWNYVSTFKTKFGSLPHSLYTIYKLFISESTLKSGRRD